MMTFVDYEIEVLPPEAEKEITLKIRVSRNEDIFTMFLDGKEICIGDWTGNLLEAFRSIVHTESTIET